MHVRQMMVLGCLMGWVACVASSVVAETLDNSGSVTLPQGIDAYIPFEESTRQVQLFSPERVWEGTYTHSEDPDHDTPEASRFDRYRVEGAIGRGLRFFSEDRSHAVVPQFQFAEPLETLVISLFVQPQARQIGNLISWRTDSAKEGFAVFQWGNRVRFQYGDGNQAYQIESRALSLTAEQWHHVQIQFDRGEVTFFLGDRQVDQQSSAGRQIAPARLPLTLGTYAATGRGRERYSFSGVLDEVIFARDRAAVTALLAHVRQARGEGPAVVLTDVLDASPQPLEGNEPHFGGSVFHSFRGRPVPLSFIFKGNAESIEHASLIVDVPREGVVIREAMQGGRNRPDRLIQLERTEIERQGVPYHRYETRDFDLTDGLRPQLAGNASPTVTLAFDGTVDRAAVYWALQVNGQRYGERHFELRLLESPPLPDQPGRFRVLAFDHMTDTAWFDATLQQAMGDLFLASNVQGKALFYGTHPKRRQAYDEYLTGRGLQLHEVGLWHGPLRYAYQDKVARALGADGKPHARNYRCPTQLFGDETFKQMYFDYAATRLGRLQPGAAVIYDYEPWGVVGNLCFCEVCIAALRDRKGIEGELTPQRIVREFREPWLEQWLDHSATATRWMTEAVDRVDRSFRKVEYTYFYNYDDPEALQRRFWSIAKDPRRHETLVDEFMLSAYHINDHALIQALDESQRHLNTPISVIVSLARVGELQGRYVTEETSLSPQRMLQKAVLCAAMGVTDMSIYPGPWIDGAYYQVFRQASEAIWPRERFYFEGQRQTDQMTFTAPGVDQDAWAAIVHQSSVGDHLVTLLNFTDEPIRIQGRPGGHATWQSVPVGDRPQPDDGCLTALDEGITVQPRGVRFLAGRMHR